MTCPTAGLRSLCLTCSLAGLVRCPDLGTPLPLVEGERTRVERKPKIVWVPAGYEKAAEDLLKKIFPDEPGLRYISEFLKGKP